MHFHAAHLHLPHPHVHPVHIDLRRIGRDTLIAAEIGLTATVVAASAGAVETTPFASSPPAVEATLAATESVEPLGLDVRAGDVGVVATVHGLDAASTTTVALVDEQGLDVSTSVVGDDALRFDQVPAGRYRIEVTSIGPIEQTAESAISSAAAVRSDPFVLERTGTVIVDFG